MRNFIRDYKELSTEEMSAICSGLARGCEKQGLIPEMVAFNKIAAYYRVKSGAKIELNNLKHADAMFDQNLSTGYYTVYNTAKVNEYRAVFRSLVWREKASSMIKSLLCRYAKEGDVMLQNLRMFVCDTCGYIWLGDVPPDMCPVCKAPSRKNQARNVRRYYTRRRTYACAV